MAPEAQPSSIGTPVRRIGAHPRPEKRGAHGAVLLHGTTPPLAGGTMPRMLALLATYSWQEVRHHAWRSATAVLAVMLGVALAFSVHLINASALAEFSSAARSASG